MEPPATPAPSRADHQPEAPPASPPYRSPYGAPPEPQVNDIEQLNVYQQILGKLNPPGGGISGNV